MPQPPIASGKAIVDTKLPNLLHGFPSQGPRGVVLVEDDRLEFGSRSVESTSAARWTATNDTNVALDLVWSRDGYDVVLASSCRASNSEETKHTRLARGTERRTTR